MNEATAPDREQELEVIPSSALDRTERAQIDVQISTAHAYPRQITRFLKSAEQMVTLNQKTADECFYVLKRKDKDGEIVRIEGPSIRLAEIIAVCWGNMRAGCRVVDEDEHFIYGEGFAHDLETNLAVRMEVSRRITSRSGRKYSDDMIGVTGNAACSIAYRNAVLRVVPKALWQPLFEKARFTARGDAKTLTDRRTALVKEFAKFKVTPEMICGYLEVGGIEDIGLDELVDLRGVFTAIINGEARAEDVFAKEEKQTNGEPRRKAEPQPQAEQAKAQPAAEAPKAEDTTGKATQDDIHRVIEFSIKSTLGVYELKRYLKKTYGTEQVADLRHDQIEQLMKEIQTEADKPR